VEYIGSPQFWGDFIFASKCENLFEISFNTKDSKFETHMKIAKPAFGFCQITTKCYFGSTLTVTKRKLREQFLAGQMSGKSLIKINMKMIKFITS